MAIQSQPSRIPEPFAGSGTKNVIPATNATPSASQAASWASGFPPECSQPISAGGCPVPRNDVNGALNQISQDFAFRQDGGIWEWSALADYDTQRMVRGSDGLLYWSIQTSGPGTASGAQDPVADDGTYWSAVTVDDSDVVHKTGAEEISGSKTVTTSLILRNKSVEKGESRSESSSIGIPIFEKEGASTSNRLASIENFVDDENNSSLVLSAYKDEQGSADSANLSIYSYGSGYKRIEFNGTCRLKQNSPFLELVYSDKIKTSGTVFPSAGSSFSDKNDDELGSFIFHDFGSGADRPTFSWYIRSPYSSETTTHALHYTWNRNSGINSVSFMPGDNGIVNLGGSSYRWSTVYAATGTINTSDERLKTDVSSIPDEVLDAWASVEFVQYKFTDSVEAKGSNARLHSGIIAQRIDKVFRSYGLDASLYGLFCYDEWGAEQEELDKNGNTLSPARDAGSQYSLRYEEALCMEAAYQRRRADRAEARLAALEERLAAIEAKLG